MTNIAISLAPELKAAGLTVRLGVLEAEITVAAADAALSAALDEMADGTAGVWADRPAAERREIAAARRAYKALGKDPSRYRPSAEALMRRVLQGKGLFRVNNVVDVNNLVSLKSGLCIGSYDTARLEPPLVLRAGADGETYDAIGRGPLNLHNLPLLADGRGPFGSPTSDSERTMIRPDTRTILLVLYDFDGDGELQDAVDFAHASLDTYCQALNTVQEILS
jgi:DNA/RNA-binding domain of Phe-tRNA-synthetase-like protein